MGEIWRLSLGLLPPGWHHRAGCIATRNDKKRDITHAVILELPSFASKPTADDFDIAFAEFGLDVASMYERVGE